MLGTDIAPLYAFLAVFLEQQQQQRRFGPLTGQIISIVRMGCRASMLCCPVRLVEAFYRCRYTESCGGSTPKSERAIDIATALTSVLLLYQLECQITEFWYSRLKA